MTYQELIGLATQIRDNSTAASNTAELVGSTVLAVIQYFLVRSGSAAIDAEVQQALELIDQAGTTATGSINTAKENALDAISEAIEGLEVHYDIETDKGTVKDVQLKDGDGNKLMPKTDAEIVEYTDDDGNKKSGAYEFLQLDNVRKSFLNNNREYASFRKGKYYLPTGALTNSANGFYTTKIPVLDKKDLKIIFKLNLSSAGCCVLFFDSSKNLIPTLNILGGTSRNGIPSMVDLSDEIYDDVAYVAFSHYGSGEHYAFLTTESNITDVCKPNIRKYVSSAS